MKGIEVSIQAVVTIKLSESELQKIYNALCKYIEDYEKDYDGSNIPELDKSHYTLKKDLKDIRRWIEDEKNEKINNQEREVPNPKEEYINKITGEESTKEQT